MRAMQQLTVIVALMRAIVARQQGQILWQMVRRLLRLVTRPRQAVLRLLLMVTTLKLRVMAQSPLGQKCPRKAIELQRWGVVQMVKVQELQR